jgi:hypothetical protein
MGSRMSSLSDLPANAWRSTPGANNARFRNVNWNPQIKKWCVRFNKDGALYAARCFDKEIQAVWHAVYIRTQLETGYSPIAPRIAIKAPLRAAGTRSRLASFSRLDEAPSPVKVYRPGDADYPA